MNRLRGGALFCAGIVFAVGVLGALELAGAVPKHFSPYRKLNVFARVLSYVENDYVEPVEESELIYGAIRGMLDTLDPHSQFMAPNEYRELKAETEGEFGGVGIEVEIRDDWLTVVSALEDTPAHRAGIKPGDRITAIDGSSTRGIRMDEAVRAMRGPRGTRVTLKVRRENEPKAREIALVRDVIRVVSVSSRMLAPGVGYLRIKTFQERTDAYAQKALEGLLAQGKLQGLILDLRNNPGGLLDQAVRIADLFIAKGLIVRTNGKGGRLLEEARARAGGTFEGFPMVCLVNSGSASASEIVAGALQDHKRAVLLGTATFGKGSVQTLIELNDGSGLKLTIARYYTPSGRSIQEQGIEPDIVVQQTQPPAVTEKAQREAQLKRHLRNTAPGKGPVSQPSDASDFQLQSALNHIRAAAIFRAQAR